MAPSRNKTRIGLIAAVGLGEVLAGCATSSAWQSAGNPTAGPERDGSALVFESDQVRLTPNRGLGFERFEFARSDADTNQIDAAPLLATNAWPQPLRPLERRIRFSDWQQR